MPELGIGLGISKGVTPKSKLLLDKYDIDAAFSLRKVRADYNGPCVRVKNNAGTFKDIGFTSSGVLDEDALNAHCGDNDGTVQTWYNQSTEGGRFNAVQDTPDDQPIIYDASAGGYLGYLENTGNRYLRFENQLTGVTDAAVVYENTTVPNQVAASAYVVGEHETAANGGDGITVGHNSVEGFAFSPGSGLSIETHTGEDQNDKHAGFVYAGGSDKFAVVDGYVCGESSNAGSANIDYIFTKAKNDGGQNTFDFVGKIWEVFLSTSDLSGKRIPLENSILSANGLTVPEQTLLEKYDGAEGAFSTRCINREHVGPILEVRGAQTTAVVEDVYLDSTGVVNKSRITELCTDDESNNDLVNGYVKTWYDQSSFGYNVTNTTEAQQPQIHDATNGVVLLNGQPAVKFDGTNDILESSFQAINTEAMICVSSEDADGTGTILRHAATFIRYKGGGTIEYRNNIELRDQTANNVTEALGEATLTSWYTKGTDFNDTNASWKWYFNGELLGTKTGNNASSEGSTIRIGAQASNQELLNGKVCEAIIIDRRDAHYDAADAIHESINKYYLIYQEATASPSSGILSEYTDPVIAFSVRQLGDANLCMRVRRSSDNAEKNFGFASDGFVDTAAVESFCGSGDGFVSCLFGQHPSCPDARQSDTSKQPKVVSSGEFIMNNGYPSIQSVGATSLLDFDNVTVGPNAFHTVLAGPASDWGSPGYMTFRSTTTIRYDLVADANAFNFSGLKVLNQQNLVTASRVGSSISVFRNGEAATQNPLTDLDPEGVVIHTDIMDSWDDGHFQENIVWNKDLDSSRFDIQQNVHDAFDTFPLEDADTTHESGFLKEFSGAAAAYSVRKLGDSPVCMRVRKTVSSVDYYQVIGFDSNGDLDTAAIEEFGGSNDVFVQTWYDQSRNGRHVTQDTNNDQPKIYDGTNGIVKENDVAALEFDGTNDVLDGPTDINQAAMTIASVVTYDNTDSTNRSLGIRADGDTTQSFAQGADLSLRYDGDFSSSGITAVADTQYLRFSTAQVGAQTDHVNGEQGINDNADLDNSNIDGTISVGRPCISSTFFNGTVQEFVLYFEDKSSIREDVSNNINNYFLVHQSASTTPATGLLSEAPGAKVAFSTRQLGDALLCMKVVSDATGNPTKNIGFKNGELDTAAIEEFCGTNIGRVETWYDQSGNGNDLTPIESNRAWVDANGNSTTFGAVGSGDKPIVFMPDGSASVDDYRFSQGFVRIGGKPAVKFRNRLMATESLGDQLRAAFSVMKKEGQNSQFVYYLNPYAYLAVAGGSSAYHEGYNVQNSRGHLGGNGSPIDEETDGSSTFFGVTNDSTVINGKDVILSHKADEPTNASTSDYMLLGGRFTSAASINASQPIVAEFIGYTDSVDFDDTRDIVETNMNSRHKIFKKFSTGLLDQYPGAVGAYSLRRLSSTYNGPLIRVVKTDDGTPERDIYANGEGDLEINQIYSHVGGRATDADTSVSVVKWYDQSGNGNHVEQSQVGNAPEIKATTQRVTRDGLRPAIEFDSNSWLSSTTVTNTGEATAYVVANSDDTGVNKAIFFVPEVFAFLTNAEAIQLYSGITSDPASGETTTIETNDTLVKNLIFFGNDGSTTFGGVNGQAFVTEANVPNSASGYDEIKIGANVNNGIRFDGKIQEAVYYNSDQRSVRAGIEKNVNKHYEVFDEPLLDVVEDAKAAYSLRKLRAGYTGPAINVYNGTDYKDIYFKADGSLDTGAISRFCGSNDGEVAIWYDQSGNNNHVTWSAPNTATKIYDGTNGLVTENGKPAIDPQGRGFDADFTYDMSSGATLSAVFFAETAVNATHLGIIGNYTAPPAENNQFIVLDDFVGQADPGDFRTRVGGGGTNVTADITFDNDPSVRTNLIVHVSDAATQDVNLYINSTTAASGTTADAGTVVVDGLFGIDKGSYNIATGTVQEMIFWESEKDREVVQANANRYYSIY